MAGCNSILGIGPPGAGAGDAATTDAAFDAPAFDGGTDASTDARIDASAGIDGGGVLTVFGGVFSVGGGVTSATTLKLVNAGFETGETTCATPGGLCVIGGIVP